MDRKLRSPAERHPLPSTDELIAAILGQLAADDERMQAFVAETGQHPANLRSGLEDGSLQAGLADYLLQTEPLIVAVAQALGREPEAIVTAASRVGGRRVDPYF